MAPLLVVLQALAPLVEVVQRRSAKMAEALRVRPQVAVAARVGGTQPPWAGALQRALADVSDGLLAAGRVAAEMEDTCDRMLAASGNAVAQRHAKLSLDPSGLVRKGKFGGIGLFDSTLEEQVGCPDAQALRGVYAEHVLSPDSQQTFSPPNNKDLVCTPEGELFFVVGKGGIDTTSWTLKPDADPTYETAAMVHGRNAKAVAALMERGEAKEAGLCDVEMVGLRLYTGMLLLFA